MSNPLQFNENTSCEKYGQISVMTQWLKDLFQAACHSLIPQQTVLKKTGKQTLFFNNAKCSYCFSAMDIIVRETSLFFYALNMSTQKFFVGGGKCLQFQNIMLGTDKISKYSLSQTRPYRTGAETHLFFKKQPQVKWSLKQRAST